jgi:HAD superfamily hydrolase (TIGR01509 family)
VKIKGVLFDIDGTLIDTVDLHAQCWDEALRHFGYEFPYDRIRSQIGKGGDQLLPSLLPKDEAERREKELSEFRSRLFKKKYMPQVKVFPGVPELFSRLKQDGVRCALASSSKKDELEHYARLLQIEEYLDAGTSADDAERSKPYPDIFQATLDQLKLPAGQCVAVGDSPWDAKSAGGAGIRTLGVRGGGFPDDVLREAGCVAIYDGPEDLLAKYGEAFQ